MKKNLLTEENIPDTIKAVVMIPDGIGLYEWAGKIDCAWREEQEENSIQYTTIRDIFPDHVIVAKGYGMGAKLFKVPYSVEPDGEIEFDFDTMTPVQLKMEWVAKSIKLDNPYVVKSVGENKLGGYGIVWGSEDVKDFHDEYFTKSTEGLTNIFDGMGAIPFLFNHGGDSAIKSQVLGKVVKMESDDVGLWYEAQITNHELYKKYVAKLISQGKLYSSSGTLPAAKSVDGSYITSWPVAEISGTALPADFHQIFDGHNISEIKSYYKSIGINDEDLVKLDTLDNQTNKSEEGTQTETEVETESLDTVNVDEEANTDAEKRELDNLSLDLEKLELELVLL
jgi:phage head maturation protease